MYVAQGEGIGEVALRISQPILSRGLDPGDLEIWQSHYSRVSKVDSLERLTIDQRIFLFQTSGPFPQAVALTSKLMGMESCF